MCLVFFSCSLYGFLLAQCEAIRTALLLDGVIQLSVKAWVPDEVHVQTVLEIEAAALLLTPHSESVRIEGHHLGLVRALFMEIVIQEFVQMFGDLVPELNAHA